MRPNLVSLFHIDLPAYFAMLAVGFALATWLGARWLGRLGQDREVVIDLGLAMVVAGVVGSRLLHVVADGHFWDYVHLCTDPSRVDWHVSRAYCEHASIGGVWDGARGVCHPREANCLQWAAFWAGGLTYYGGLIGATGYAVYFLRREAFPFWKAADMAGFAVALGLAWGRMGCFLAGCCFGVQTARPWGAIFPAFSPASEAQFREHVLPAESLPSLPVHPTQLYESLGCLLIAAACYYGIAPRKRYDGQVFVWFLASYSVLRTLLEFLRNDERGGLLGLSTSQLISLAICLPLPWLAVQLKRRAARVKEGAPVTLIVP
ncbi:MAG: prolipoprotein diacylglyceryl transferase [Myxococcales bacterium]|nr:prolipoprotein diacylglyceryl transferase [Myxococcales bacterium]